VLDRARWTVGKLEITLPNGIGQVMKFGDKTNDGRYAVTVDDVIVFNTNPGTFRDNPWWWGHEVTHVEQFQQMGVDQFCVLYVSSGGTKLEQPANRRGDQVLNRSLQTGQASAQAALVQTPAIPAERPLLPAFALTSNTHVATQPAVQDPAIVQCVFPRDGRPINYVCTQAGRLIAIDRNTGQWMQIGFALPPQLLGVAWEYYAVGAFYDVLPDGRIMQRLTPTNAQQVGFVQRLQ
jgi:hypothetical protein